MFLIRRIYDVHLEANRAAVASVQALMRERFSAVPQRDIDALPEKLDDPVAHRFSAVLYVAERDRAIVGFAFVLREPTERFHYLDFIASDTNSQGVGGALYERLREDARAQGVRGIFFECLPDDPGSCEEALLEDNRARLRFYERWGAVPIIGTKYEKPVQPGDTCMPHLVFDGLDRGEPLRASFLRRVVRAILERKYGHLCPPEYVEEVVASIHDPVRLREPRHHPKKPKPRPRARAHRYPVIVNDKHDIHHVRERGYVQSPARIGAILKELEKSEIFRQEPPRKHGIEPILAVHDRDFVDYLERACAKVPAGKSLYPYVFPIRNPARKPRDLTVRAGYYCIDTFTPINRNAYLAARRAVDCALTGADRLLAGERVAYALVRPPGHHAERRSYGGFCYFNNCAVAAHYLSEHGRVAIVDIDYHHGNGQQDIFYERSDVLTVSIHGHPNIAYPYFTGFEDEQGAGAGEGFNLNIPLPEKVDGSKHRKALRQALERVVEFDPAFVVVALGLDTARGDPTGSWSLTGRDFEENGRILGTLGRYLLVVQEGGYRSRTLGSNAAHFFRGLSEALRQD